MFHKTNKDTILTYFRFAMDIVLIKVCYASFRCVMGIALILRK